MPTTNNVANNYGQTLALIRGPSPRALAGVGTGAGTEVDCRSALVTAVAELTPALRPVRTLLDACRDDPGRFQAEVLGRRLWTKQVEVCQAIARSPITVVPAGRAVGKSFLLAGTVLWWLYTRPGSLVITTGPDRCGEAGEFLPFQPEKIVERSAQLPKAVVVSVEFSAARVQGTKSDLSGGEGGTNEAQAPGERCAALHPDPPWEELTPRARSAIEARTRDRMADITMRGEPMRSKHPLRE